MLVNFLSLDVYFERPAGTTSVHTVTLFLVAGLRVGVVGCGLWGTVTLFWWMVLRVGVSAMVISCRVVILSLLGVGGEVTGSSISSGISFRLRIEKYVLSIAFRNIALFSSAPLIFFGFGGGYRKF